MTPDRFFITQFLVFVVWMALLLWAPGLSPSPDRAIIVKKGTPAATAKPPPSPDGASPAPAPSPRVSAAEVVPPGS